MAVKLNSILFFNEFRDEFTDYLIGTIGSRITAYLDIQAEWFFQADADLNKRISFDGLTAIIVDTDGDPTGDSWASFGFFEGDTVTISGTASNNVNATIVSFSVDGLTATFAAAFVTETSDNGLITGTTEVTGLSHKYNLIENGAAVDYNSLIDGNELRYNKGALSYTGFTQTTAIQQGIYQSNYQGTVKFEGYGRQFTDTVGVPFVFATAGNTITWADGDFIRRGIKVGDSLTIAGTASNNGTIVVTAVTATVVTTSTNLVNETSPGAATITRAAVLNRFTVEHTFDIIPFYLPSQNTDFLQDIAPDYFFNAACLRYVWETSMLYNLNDPNRVHKTDESEFLIGNTGEFNENFNGDNNEYVIADPTFVVNGSAVDDPDHLNVTSFSIALTNTTNTPFSNNNTKFVVGCFWLPENDADCINTATDFATNFMYDRQIQTLGSAAVNGENFGTAKQVLRDIVGTFTSSSAVTITGKLDLSSAYKTRITAATNKRCVIFIQIQKHSLATEVADLVTLKPSGALTYDPDYSNPLVGGTTVDFIEQYHADFTGLNPKPTAGNFVEDDVISRSRFWVDIANDALIDSFNVVLKASHATFGEFELERRNFSFATAVVVSGVQNMNIDMSRGFAQDEDYKGNWVILERDSASDVADRKYYNCYYGFKLRWEYFKQLTGVSTQFFDTAEDFNGFNHDWQRYWAASGWTIYFATELNITESGFQNTIETESEVTIYDYAAATDWSSDNIVVLRDSDNTDLGAFLITNELMRIEATHTYIGGALPVLANIEGEIKIEKYEVDGEMNVHEISTADDLANPDGQLLVSVLGTNLLKKEFIAPDKFKFTAYLDHTKLDLSQAQYKISSRIYPAVPLATPPCADNISFTLSGTGEDISITLRSAIGKNCTINWGDGTTTAANGTGANVTYTHTYVAGSFAGYICGDIDFLTTCLFPATTQKFMLQTIDMSKMGSSALVLNQIGFGVHKNLYYFVAPLLVTSCVLCTFGTAIGGTVPTDYNVLTSLDLSTIPVMGGLVIHGFANLSTLDLHPTLTIDENLGVTANNNLVYIVDTSINKSFDFDVNIHPARTSTDLTWTYKSNDYTNVLTLANVESMIEKIYTDRNVFTNGIYYHYFEFFDSIYWAADMSTGAYAVTGTYQAPTGYIQADAVTVGNDGTPASPMEKLYVLWNQKIDNTVTKKYNILITY